MSVHKQGSYRAPAYRRESPHCKWDPHRMTPKQNTEYKLPNHGLCVFVMLIMSVFWCCLCHLHFNVLYSSLSCSGYWLQHTILQSFCHCVHELQFQVLFRFCSDLLSMSQSVYLNKKVTMLKIKTCTCTYKWLFRSGMKFKTKTFWENDLSVYDGL